MTAPVDLRELAALLRDDPVLADELSDAIESARHRARDRELPWCAGCGLPLPPHCVAAGMHHCSAECAERAQTKRRRS